MIPTDEDRNKKIQNKTEEDIGDLVEVDVGEDVAESDAVVEEAQEFEEQKEIPQPKETLLQKIVNEMKVRWLLIAIVCTLLLAYAIPSVGRKGGPLKSETTSKIAIGLIFVCSGFTMKAQMMLKALMQWKLHLFIQVFSFLVFPAFTFLIVKALGLVNFNQRLLDGMIILACIPITITSNVVVTAQAEGNEAASLFNSALGNTIGVVVSPSVLYFFYSSADIFAKVPIGKIFLNLFLTVILPLAIGQIIRLAYLRIFKNESAFLNKFVNYANGGFLLYVLFCIFSDAFQAKVNVSSLSLAATLGIVIFIHFAMDALAFVLAMPKFWGFSRADKISALFCSPQKTLSIGLVLMDRLFGDDPDLVLVTVPLVMYHPVQILTSSLLVPKLKSWKRQETSQYGPIPLVPM